jgi:large subunit ribosomal protein L10
MPRTKEQKELIVSNIKNVIKEAKSIIFVGFSRLTVAETEELRATLSADGSTFMVVKKTLLTRVLKDTKLEGNPTDLQGEVAICYGEDLVLPAQKVDLFARGHDQKLVLLGGIIEGKFISGDEANRLAHVPPREILYGKFLGTISSPVSGFVYVTGGIISGFVRALSEIAKVRA